MAPKSLIFLTRHAEGYHNVAQDWSIRDPSLTPRGQEQAESAAALISDLHQQADLIVTSALRRTLQTTLRTWRPAIDRLGIENVICLPEAQECLDFPCDCGSDRADLEREQEFEGLNFDRLTPDWNSKTGFWAPDHRSVANRTKWVRHFLRDRPEKNIVLVAHGDFLREITCDSSGPDTYYWDQVEIQIFEFDPNTVDKDECFLSRVKKIDTKAKSKA